MAEPKQNTAFTLFLGLEDTAGSGFVVDPTIAAGDFQVSIDGGAFANLATLPVVAPAGAQTVQVDLSAAEMDGDNVVVRAVDQAGSEWKDVLVAFELPKANITDVFDSFANSASVVDAAGVRTITVFEDDDVTTKFQVEISADGLTRTKL